MRGCAASRTHSRRRIADAPLAQTFEATLRSAPQDEGLAWLWEATLALILRRPEAVSKGEGGRLRSPLPDLHPALKTTLPDPISAP